MLVRIPDVLSPAQLQECRRVIEQAEWVDGRVTAGFQSAKAKRNMQASEGHPATRRAGDMILAALERGEAHGLEILRRLEADGCGLLALKEGSLYPALYRLEAAGDVAAAWEKESSGRRGPRGRVYRLTAKGQRRLAQGREEWQSFVATIGNILLGSTA